VACHSGDSWGSSWTYLARSWRHGDRLLGADLGLIEGQHISDRDAGPRLAVATFGLRFQSTAHPRCRPGRRADHPDVTVGIGAPFGPHLVVPALLYPRRMGGLVNDTLPELQRGVDQRLWHTRAVPGAIHEHHAGVARSVQIPDHALHQGLYADDGSLRLPSSRSDGDGPEVSYGPSSTLACVSYLSCSSYSFAARTPRRPSSSHCATKWESCGARWGDARTSRADSVEILQTPFRTPNANAFAERFVRTVRSECLDHLLVVNELHLERILSGYARHYNGHRPHQGLAQEIPAPERAVPLQVVRTSDSRYRHHRRRPARICRHDRLGGLIHEYELAA
jgi:putative transposase